MSVSESPWLTLLKEKAEEEHRFRLELFFNSLPLVEEKKSSGAPDDFTYLFGGAARVSQLAESDQDDDEDDGYDEWYTAPVDELNISSVSVQFGRAGAARAPREFVDPDQDDNEGARAAREFVDPDQDDNEALEHDDNDDATKYQVPLAVTRAKFADAETESENKRPAPDPCYEGKQIKVEELDEADCQVDFTSTLEAILSFI